MNNADDISTLLLRVASLSTPPDDSSLPFPTDDMSMSRLCDQVRDLLPNHALSDDEIVVIAVLHTGKQWFDVIQPTRSRIFQILTSLREKKIVEVESLPTDLIEDTLLPPLAYLNRDVLKSLKESCSECNKPRPFASNREYLLTWLHAIKLQHRFRENQRNEHPIHGLASERSLKGYLNPTETERKFAQEETDLISRSQINWERFPVERVVHQLEIDPNERRILLFVLLSELTNERCTIDDLLTLTSKDVLDGLDKDRYWRPDSMLRLYDLISIEDSRQSQRLRTPVTMRSSVKRWLATGEGTVPGLTDCDDSGPYPNEYAHIEDWIRFGRMWVRLSRLAGADRRNGDEDESDLDDDSMRCPSTHPLLISMKARIERKTKASPKQFPLNVLSERHGLSDKERDILVMLLESATVGRDLDLNDLTLFMTSDVQEQHQIAELLSPESKLVVEGLIQLTPRRNGTYELALPIRVKYYLLGVSDYCEPTLCQLIVGDSLLSIVHPTTTLVDLILPTGIMELLQTGLSRYTTNANALLQEWGIIPTSEAGGTAGKAGSLLILLSGASGTGKTLAAHCFAGSLGKDIVVTDCSKILDFWFGNSEKNISQLFSTIRSINRRAENPPVLLLNEADQLLSRRTTQAQHSTDRTHHQIQNLLLENLENYTGILIATTNLIDSIDEAFSRRFDLKIVFPMPDAIARLAIWKKHLPPTVPLADDVDLRTLADQYEFSGGQIAVAVKNAATTAAIRGDMIHMDDLVAACRAEAEGAFDTRSTSRKKAVGFISPQPELRMQTRVHPGR